MTGKMIPIPRHAGPCQGPLDRSRGKRNDLPRRRERKRQPAPAATNNTLRMSSDAGPILRNAERRYSRSPALFPKQRHATSAQPDDALTAPVLPAPRQDGGFFCPEFSKAAAFPPDSLPESGMFRFYGEMHFFTVCERKLLKPQYLWQTRDANPSYI